MLKVFPVMSTPKGAPSFSNDWHMPRSGGRLHEGNDIFADRNTPLIAVVDGMLKFGSNHLGGNTATITAPDGTRFYYAHLNGFEGKDRPVKVGDVIGYVGNTGADWAPPHLHFGIYVNNAAINPYEFLVAAPLITQAKPTVIETVSAPAGGLIKYGLMAVGGFALGYTVMKIMQGAKLWPRTS